MPDLGLGPVLAAGSTDLLGNASLPAPLPGDPALVGGTFYQQWLRFTGDGCLGAFALSNAQAVQLQ